MPLDFLDQPLEQLRCVTQNYEAFSRAAEKLEWMDVEEQHEDWWRRSDPIGIQLDVFKFPEDYVILHHIADVYARVVLSTMAYYEEWSPQFWDMPQTERRQCLEQGMDLYKNYAMFRESRLISREWTHLVKEISFFAGYNKVPVSSQNKYLDQFENAKVIELGGCDAGDATYWAIKHNALLVVDCGCWD